MNETNGSKRKKLDEDHVIKIIREWNEKSIDDFATEFEVASNTIRSMVYKIRKQAPDKCPRKPKKKREDIIRAALERIRAEETAEDTVTER
jgi:transposase